MMTQRDSLEIKLDLQTPNEAPLARPITYRSVDLLQGRNEAWIEHEGAMYRLRLTSAGKLYLTK